MNKLNQNYNNIQQESKLSNFIHLKKYTFAEYNFVFHINNGFSIMRLSKFNGKHQLLFQKIDNKICQMNLMVVDSIFPLILADVVLETLLSNISSFYDYTKYKKRIVINDLELNRSYLEIKFKNFIYYLIYSNISSDNVFKRLNFADKIYYLKNEKNELQFYSIYEQKDFQDLLFKKIKLSINFDKSFIYKGKAILCFKIVV